MSVYYTNCINCSTANLTVEDLLRKAFVCDGSGNAYLRTWNPSTTDPFCGYFSDYVVETRNVDGVDHDGLVITHGLNTLNPLFITVLNALGVEVVMTYSYVDPNNIFLITDGAESENMSFCISK